MKKRAMHVSDQAVVDLNPMLDVVFILLIFFILISSFVVEQSLPETSSDAATSQLNDVIPVVVEIKEGGEMHVDKRRVEKSALRAIFTQKHGANNDVAVIIYAEEYAPVDSYVAVMDASRKADIKSAVLKIKPAGL